MDQQNNSTQVIPQRLHPSQFYAGILKPLMLAATTTVAKGDIYYSDGSKFIRLPAVANAALVIQNGVPTWIAGASGSVTIPKLTTTNGSLTLVNGVITAFVNPT